MNGLTNKVDLSLCVALLCVLCISSCATYTEPTNRPDFRTALGHHLNAVENRDLETFKETLTGTQDLNVIFPGGSILEGTQAVIDFHTEWFLDPKWVFKTEVVKVIEGDTQSTALVRYSFQDSAAEPARHAWLVLTFQLEDGQWRLIHDQNTRIDPTN